MRGSFWDALFFCPQLSKREDEQKGPELRVTKNAVRGEGSAATVPFGRRTLRKLPKILKEVQGHEGV